MFIYFFIFLVVVSLGLTGDLKRRKTLAGCISAMVVVGGFRFETGYDWLAYELAFKQIDTSGSLIDALGESAFEPLYFLLCYAVKLVGGGASGVFFLGAAISGFALYTVLRTFTVNFATPLVMYIGFCYLIAFFILVRYSFAAAFVLLALGETFRQRRLNAVALVALAAGFHIFSLVFLPLLLLAHVRIRISTFVVAVVSFAALSYYIDVSRIFSVFALLEGGVFISKFVVYASTLESEIPPSVYLFMIFNVLVFWIVARFLRAPDDRILANTAAWLSLMVVVGIILFYPVPSIWNRLMLVAVPIQGIALAKVFQLMRGGQRVFSFCVVSTLSGIVLAYSVLQEHSFFVPYESQLDALFGTSSGVGRARMEREFQ